MPVLNNIEIKSIEDVIDVGAWCDEESKRLGDEAKHARGIIREYDVDQKGHKIFGRLFTATIHALAKKRPTKFNKKLNAKYLAMAVAAGVITERQVALLEKPQDFRAQSVTFRKLGK